MDDGDYVRRVVRYIVSEWRLLAAVAALTLLSTLLGLAVPVVVRRAVNELIGGGAEGLLTYSLGIVALTAAQGLVSFGRSYYSEYLSQKVVFRLRDELYRHLQELSFSFYDRVDAGQIIARATGDVGSIRAFTRFFSRGLMGSAITLASSVAVMLQMSAELTAIALAVAPATIAVVAWYSRRIRPLAERRRHLFGEMNSRLQESIVGMKTIRALACERVSLDRFLPVCSGYLDASVEMGRLRAVVRPLIFAIGGLDTLAIYWYGGVRVSEGALTVGDLVAFTMYLSMLIWPLVSLGFFAAVYQRAAVAARRIFEILDAEPEVKERPGAVELRDVRGHIKLEDVWFSYDGRRWVLRGVNLEIRPGEKVAIVGPVGCGKSSLIKLIPRFYDPQRGRVLIDGVDVRDVKIESLRRHVAVVHQDVFIFPDTIRNNIAFGKPGASMEEVVKAAKAARIHDFIESLPDKYDTVVGERGVNLSGGQRQRLAIARALLLNPKVVILDDSTSQVDAKTEREIHEALKELVKGRTCILVTQRFSTLSLADRIVVMDGGRVVEEGTHEELLRRGKLYPKLYESFIAPQADGRGGG